MSSAELKIINENALGKYKLAQGFRNLIHPGKSKRQEMKCDRATALACRRQVLSM